MLFKRSFFLLLCLGFPIFLKAQITPVNGDTLNYTQVLFSFPWRTDADTYVIELSEDQSFTRKYQYQAIANAKVISGLSFGNHYYWRYAGVSSKGEQQKWSKTFAFYTGNNFFTDPTHFRYTGKKKERKKANKGILLMDYGRVAMNRAGKIIWYMPDFPFLGMKERVRDLKLTKEGTLTALLDSLPCEFDLNGKIIWQAPDDGKVNGEKSEFYHHDFKKLPNGNYMVLGTDHVYRKTPNVNDSMQVEFGTIIEYDLNGNVVWSWNSNDYFTDKDLFSRPRGKKWNVRTHMNAFGTDGRRVFAGFRDISRIVVIDKKSGKVTESYGGYGYPEELHSATGFFRRQHDATLLSDGNLAVVNNDSIMDPSVVSSLVIFSQIADTDPISKKVFEFKFDFDSLTNGKSPKTGNLQEMKNGNILVNMGSINRCIEVTRTGDVVWDMFMERYDSLRNIWVNFPQYRVSYTPTLYPYVFRSRVMKDQTVSGNRKLSLRIYNVGGMEDRYKITVWKDGEIINSVTSSATISIDSEETGEVKLSFPQSRDITLRITSENSLLQQDMKLR